MLWAAALLGLGNPSASAAEDAAWGPDPVLEAFARFQRDSFGSSFPILSRQYWRARAPRGEEEGGRPPSRITIHHTAGLQALSREDTLQEARRMQAYHQDERGWTDLGYHFLIDGRGRVVAGRPLEARGAHAEGDNEGNIGVALMGDFSRQRPTAAQVESLSRLVAYLSARYGIDPSRRLTTHRHLDRTDCPGRNLEALLAKLRRDAGPGRAEAPHEPAARQPGRIILHHTAGAAASGLAAGFHFLIDGQGRVQAGLPVETAGAPAEEARRSIDVGLVGDFNAGKPTPAQLEGLVQLLAYLCARYDIDPGRRLFTHQRLERTDCPGRGLEALLPGLRRDVAARLPGQRGSRKPAPVLAVSSRD